MRISGSGLSISMTAPNTMDTAPPAASTPCEVNLASSANSVKANSSSAAPSQLMGRMDMAESPSNTRMAPTTPGAVSPRRRELYINAQCADHQQDQRDVRIGDGGDDLLA